MGRSFDLGGHSSKIREDIKWKFPLTVEVELMSRKEMGRKEMKMGF